MQDHAITKEPLLSGRGKGLKIAVLDSGIEASHPALDGLQLADDVAIIESCDGHLQASPGNNTDLFGHGTAVCGIIRQIAPEAEIGSIRVLGENLRSRSAIIREGARLAIRRGYHILNCSFGCSREDHVLFYKDWVDEAYVAGRHIVAACNNQDFARREWPGHFPTVITVNHTLAALETVFHRPGSLVEFLAHGQDVNVPWLNGATKTVSGSSFACARVTGLLARLLSTEGAGKSTLEAKTLLKNTAQRWQESRQESGEPQEEAAA